MTIRDILFIDGELARIFSRRMTVTEVGDLSDGERTGLNLNTCANAQRDSSAYVCVACPRRMFSPRSNLGERNIREACRPVCDTPDVDQPSVTSARLAVASSSS